MTQPMASLPVVIFNFALSAYDDWRRLAWVGALLIAVAVLAVNIIGRVRRPGARTLMNDRHRRRDDRRCHVTTRRS